jgi:hypothetical protein
VYIWRTKEEHYQILIGHALCGIGQSGCIRLLQTLIAERPDERKNIAHFRGLTETQKTNLRALGAIEEDEGEGKWTSIMSSLANRMGSEPLFKGWMYQGHSKLVF